MPFTASDKGSGVQSKRKRERKEKKTKLVTESAEYKVNNIPPHLYSFHRLDVKRVAAIRLLLITSC